jgi:putative membrane protein
MKTTQLNPACGWAHLLVAALLIGQAAILSLRAADTAENRGQFSAADYRFIRAAASGGAMEVTLGNLAAQHSTSPAIQDFGKRMVEDHSKAGQELEQLAAKKGASFSAQPTAEQQRHIDHLSALTGSDFDEAYIAMMVRDHKADEKEFKRASEKAQNPELKAFAALTLRTVQEHLALAESIEPDFKPSTSTR